MTDSEILDAANRLLAPQLSNPYISLMSEYNSLHRLEGQLGSTQNSLSSLEGALEDISMGAKRNGKMSVVRRFFCLFVLFDLLLITMTWLICIVMAAVCRFTVLLLFYGLLQLSTTFFVAFTTLATCVFLICKIIFYSWSTASQPVLQVILVLMSFVVAWAEAWFLDFRVRPQEFSASTYAQAVSHFSESMSKLLVDRNLSPVMRQFLENMASGTAPTESIGNFYSPLESPNNSGDESDDQDIRKDQVVNIEPHPGGSNSGNRGQVKMKPFELMRKDMNVDYQQWGKDTLEVAWSILNEKKGWVLQQKNTGEAVLVKYVERIGKVYLLYTIVNISAKKLLNELFNHVEKFTTWNKTVIESRRVQSIDEHTDITYQVSAPGVNGLVSSRDFVVLRHWAKKGECYVLSGISVPYPGLPVKNEYVRGENGPCCWAMTPLKDYSDSCEFWFLLNTNLKGWLAQPVVEMALTSVLMDYSTCLKEHCKTVTSEEVA